MANIKGNTLAICLLAMAVAGCGKNAEESAEQIVPVDATDLTTRAGAAEAGISEWTETSELNLEKDQTTQVGSLSAVLDPGEIPYPLYPNGSRYRIGGEGELKIVLFQTEDSFEEVDAYYQKEANLPRLSAMSDYVRYSTENSDIDPWETSKPGIVIHQFNNAKEREAVGADGKAQTNIIMSFE